MDINKSKSLVLLIILLNSLIFTLSTDITSASSTNQVFWGAFVGPSHIDQPSQFESFEQQVGKGMSIWHIFVYWDRPKDLENNPYFDADFISWMNTCRTHGAIPMVTFDPGNGGKAPDDSTGFYYYLPLIIRGDYDAYLHTWAKAAHDWEHPFFIRFIHEMMDGFTPSQATQFIQAWKHTVDIFRAEGANNVSWVWSNFNKQWADGYPGDNYVDWTDIAGYAWNGESFDSLFLNAYYQNLQVAPTKPIMIAEIGVSGSSQPNWWNDLFNKLPSKFPNIKAIVIWQYLNSGGGGADVTTDTATLMTFQKGISSNYYSSNVFSNISTLSITEIGENPNSTSLPTSTSISGVYSTATIITVLEAGAVFGVMVALAVLLSIRLKNRKHKNS